MKYDIKICLPLYKIMYALFFIIIMVLIRGISSAGEIIAAIEPYMALLACVFMADNYYKEFANDRIQVFYRYSLQKKYISVVRGCIINWIYLIILTALSYLGYIWIYQPVNLTDVSNFAMFINAIVACAVSILFIGVLSFTLTNYTQSIGLGIGITFIIWGCLTSSASTVFPEFLQLFLLKEPESYSGALIPYYLSRVTYLIITIILFIINIIILQMQPKYKKKGWVLKHGNNN